MYLTPIQVKGGSSLIIPINFTGIPTPKVTWFHEDTPLEQTTDITINTNSTFSTLTVNRCTLEQSGRYRCEVSNKAGTDKANFSCVVTGELPYYFMH